MLSSGEGEVGHESNRPSTGPGEGPAATARSQARHETLPHAPCVLAVDVGYDFSTCSPSRPNFYEANCCFIIQFHPRWPASQPSPAQGFLLRLLAQKPGQHDLGTGHGINAEDGVHAMEFQASFWFCKYTRSESHAVPLSVWAPSASPSLCHFMVICL